MNIVYSYHPNGKPKEIDTGFKIPEPVLWGLDVPAEEINISEIENNLDILYLEKEGTDDWNLSIRELLNNFEREKHHAAQTMAADLFYPIELYYFNNQWIVLDGVHRLAKAVMIGEKTIKARKISQDIIDNL